MRVSHHVGLVAIDGRFAVGQRRGIGKGSLELLRALIRLDSNLHFDVLVDRQPEPGLIDPGRNWAWRRLRPGGYPLWEQVRLPMYLARRRPAILHSVGNTAPVVPLSGTKLVVTVHDLIFFESWRLQSRRQRLGRIYRRLIVPAAVRRADWVITDSASVRDQLVARFPGIGGRVSVIGIPVAAQFFDYGPTPTPHPDPAHVGNPATRSTLAPPQGGREIGGAPYLVAFSAIDPRKNIPRVIEAFARARQRLPDSELVLVGSQRPDAAAQAPGIRVLTYVPDAELMRLLASSRALVYASLSEGFGVPILEAMALGVPVITSDREPMKELAGGAAMLVDPTDVDAVADAMVRILTDGRERQRLANAGRARAEAFRPATIARQTAELYTQLARSTTR